MRYIFFLLTLSITLVATTKSDLATIYKNKEYKKACLYASRSLESFKKDEDYLSLMGFACLKSGYIDRLATPIANLKSTPQARANAAYFSVVLMQKKLLLHSLVDHFPLSSLQLPTTKTLLSKIFDLYVAQQNFTKESYLFHDKKDANTLYKLYIKNENEIKKMVLEKIINNNIVEKYIYW